MRLILYLLFILWVPHYLYAQPDIIVKNGVSGNQGILNPDSLTEKIREIEFEDQTGAGLLISDEKIFISMANGLIHCIDVSGDEKWTAEIIGTVRHGSLHYRDLFLSATIEGDLYSINANNGEIVQVLGTGEKITTDLCLIDLFNPGYQSKGVVFGTESGKVYCYDIFTFALVWMTNLSGREILSSPLIAEDKIVFIDSTASLYCINSKSGALIWRYTFSEIIKDVLFNFHLLVGNKIISLTPAREIISLDRLTGKKTWISRPIPLLAGEGIYLYGEELFFINEKRQINFISAKDGRETHKIEPYNPEITGIKYHFSGSTGLMGFSDGSVFSLSSGKEMIRIIGITDEQVSSLKFLSEKTFILMTRSGRLSFYKIIY